MCKPRFCKLVQNLSKTKKCISTTKSYSALTPRLAAKSDASSPTQESSRQPQGVATQTLHRATFQSMQIHMHYREREQAGIQNSKQLSDWNNMYECHHRSQTMTGKATGAADLARMGDMFELDINGTGIQTKSAMFDSSRYHTEAVVTTQPSAAPVHNKTVRVKFSNSRSEEQHALRMPARVADSPEQCRSTHKSDREQKLKRTFNTQHREPLTAAADQPLYREQNAGLHIVHHAAEESSTYAQNQARRQAPNQHMSSEQPAQQSVNNLRQQRHHQEPIIASTHVQQEPPQHHKRTSPNTGGNRSLPVSKSWDPSSTVQPSLERLLKEHSGGSLIPSFPFTSRDLKQQKDPNKQLGPFSYSNNPLFFTQQ